MPGLSFITLLAYDYRYAFQAIETYYALADEVILGLDSERLSWMQKPFDFDMEELEAFIAQVDIHKKIKILESDFHSNPNPKENEHTERLLLTRNATAGNWLVSIDADEVLLNGAAFKEWLLRENPKDYNVYGSFMTIFKTFEGESLVCDPAEQQAVATMLPSKCRVTGQPAANSPLWGVHGAYGRTPNEVYQKLTNWAHARDFDTQRFFEFWQSVTLENFEQIRDFHPLGMPRAWQSLKRVKIT